MVYWTSSSWPVLPLDGVSDLSATAWMSQATIKWTDPNDLVVKWYTLTTWTSSKLVRKIGSAPTTSSDGTLVLTETTRNQYSSTWYTDTGLTNSTTYYYAVFAVWDNWTEIISNTVSVMPWWQPWTDTLAYYPFTSNWNDESWNGYHLSSTNSTSVVTLWDIKALDMNNSYCTTWSISGTSLLITTLPYTIVFWTKAKASWLNKAFAITWYEWWSWWWSGISAPTSSWWQIEVRAWNTTNQITKWNAGSSYADTNWHLYVVSFGTSWLNVYVDWNTTPVRTTNWSVWPENNGSPLIIGARQDYTVCGNWYISRVIIEKKAWTAQESQDYYNSSKWIYWIS